MFQIRWIWRNMDRKYRVGVIAALLISVVTSVMLLINPALTAQLIDQVIIAENTEPLLRLLTIMLVAKVLREGLRYLMIVCLEKGSQNVVFNLRRRLFAVLQYQEMRFFDRNRTGDLMTRMTNDLDLIRHSLAWISYVTVDSVVVFLVTLIYLFTVSWKLTLCLAAVTPFILVITRIFSKIIHPMYVRLRDRLSALNTVAQENIAGNRVVKAFAREEFEKQKFDEKNQEFRDTNLKTTYVGVKFNPVIDLLSQSLTIITLLAGGIFMINGELTAGEMMAFSSLTWALANPLKNLGMLINDIQRFSASSAMIIEIFYAQPTIVEHASAKEPDHRLRGDLDFDHVNLKVGGKTILQDIDLHIAAGQKLGIMGTTGSGKTSLINLLNRFYDVTDGTVSIDGIDVREIPLSTLRRSVSMAMQDVFLFSDTVEGNIAYGAPEMPFEEVRKWAKAADADGFVNRMEEGYDTLIGERGVGLSGGQRQRISLARAIAMKPSVLVLDDTTSAVDMETEKYIQHQLRNLPFPCTKVMIAQKVSSVQDADEIIILDEGKIIERGTHEELLAKRGYYYGIWALQNSIEEVDPLGA